MYLVFMGTIVFLVTPTVVELLVWVGDLGCGHPILMSVWSSITIFLAAMKSPASLGSAAEDMNNLMISTMARIAPLILSKGSF